MFSGIGAIEEQLLNVLKPGDIKIPRDITLTQVTDAPVTPDIPTGINLTHV